MKIALLIAAALGLSVSGAAAECAGHTNTTASAEKQTTVASADKQTTVATATNSKAMTTADTPVIVKKEEAKESE
jgi:hypothetical protein